MGPIADRGIVGKAGVTQRVAAILAADAVGYSRLMADDEPATIDALDTARAVFTQHIENNQGRVVDTAGDSVLAIFEITEGAVLAAVAIQDQLAEINTAIEEARRMRFRIGLHLGDIREKADGSIYGDGVNVAARLEGLAKPGAIIVSDVVQGALRGRLDIRFADAGSHEVKNIAEPVRAFRVLGEGEVAPASRKKRAPIWAGVAAAAVVIAGIAAWQLTITPEPAPTEVAQSTEDPILAVPIGPSIAVLPFDNLSGDPEQDYFVDGISEDILTQLSQFEAIKVIARNSTFQFKGQALDVREIGQRLDAQYVLEGSVRRGEDQLRITAQLLDAEDGSHMWAKNYDRDLDVAALFEVQDEITSEIAGILASTTGVISRTEIAAVKRKPPESLEAYECILLAHVYQQLWEEESHLAARNCLERTVEADPTYAEAWAWLGHIHAEEAAWGYNAQLDHPDPPLLRAELAAKRALEEDRRNQRAYLVLASIYYTRQDMAGFVAEAEQGLTINPNDADALGEMAWRFCYGVDWERGLAMMEKAKAINPLHPPWYHVATFFYAYVRGRDDEALVEARKAEMPGAYLTYYSLAAVYGQLGRKEEAADAVATLLELYPDFRDKKKAREELESKLFKDPDLVERLMDGLEKAGLFDVPEAARPVIAVLPFDNLSGDPEQEYFADGITADIITVLSRFQFVGVIARNSTFQYKGQAVDIQEVAKELNADYVLEGSVRRLADRVRFGVQLVEGKDATHVWSQSYDRDLTASDIFDIQDDIAQRVATTIAGRSSVIIRDMALTTRNRGTDKLSSYECLLRMYEYDRILDPVTHLAARECMEATLAEEPDYAEAWGSLAELHADSYALEFNPVDDPLGKALEAAERAIALDPTIQQAQWALAITYFQMREKEKFLSQANRVIALNPNNAYWKGTIGWGISWAGEWNRGKELIDEAIALNPFHPGWWHYATFFYEYRLGNFENALSEAETVGLPEFFWTPMTFAAAYGQLGQREAAEAEVRKLLGLNPDVAVRPRFYVGAYVFEGEVIEHFIEGLRKAGMEIPELTD